MIDAQEGSPVIQVPPMIKNLDRVVWLRTEYIGRWDLVIDRDEQAKILGTTPQLVSSRMGNYPEKAPRPVAKYGTRRWMLRTEFEEFVAWLEQAREQATGKNKGNRVQRTVTEKAASEIVRLTRRRDTLEEQKAALVQQVKEKTAEINRVKARIEAQTQLRDASR